MHVAAKRYLCTVEPKYRDKISGGSETTLRMQGGLMSDEELEEFRATPFSEDAVQILHCIFDLIAKSVFGFALARFRSYYDKKMYEMVNYYWLLFKKFISRCGSEHTSKFWTIKTISCKHSFNNDR